MNARRAFTLIELLVVVLIIATLATLSMDLFRMQDAERIEGAVRLFRSDVEWARSATLTKPDDPATIRLLDDGSGWCITRASTPTVTLSGSDGVPLRRVFGEDSAPSTDGMTVAPSGSALRVLEFDPFGGLRTGPSELRFTLPDSTNECLITIEAGTGNLSTSWINP